MTVSDYVVDEKGLVNAQDNDNPLVQNVRAIASSSNGDHEVFPHLFPQLLQLNSFKPIFTLSKIGMISSQLLT